MKAMGLDFGTTNSALALLEGKGARVVNISNGGYGEKTLRSVLFFDEYLRVTVGQQAIDRYAQFDGADGRLMQSLKSLLSDPEFKETNIFGKFYDLEALVSLIIGEIKIIGEKVAGGRVDKVVLGRPVFFSEDAEKDKLAQERLHLAALGAGFRDVNFELEPIAATLAYSSQMKGGEQIVLMGDFGGGTSDFTVVRLRPNATSSQAEREVLSVGGIYVGGDTFDSRIMWEKITSYFGREVTYISAMGDTLQMPAYIVRSICKWHIIPFLREQRTLQSLHEIRKTADKPRLVKNLEDLILENKGFKIFQAIERAKKELSSNQQTKIMYEDRNLRIDEVLRAAEFEAFISQDLTALEQCVVKVVADAGLTSSDISNVLLTGGSSFVPAVRRIFERTFGDSKIVYLDAFTSVAHGLALSALYH
jgi:hypothetical chaperone protein